MEAAAEAAGGGASPPSQDQSTQRLPSVRQAWPASRHSRPPRACTGQSQQQPRLCSLGKARKLTCPLWWRAGAPPGEHPAFKHPAGQLTSPVERRNRGHDRGPAPGAGEAALRCAAVHSPARQCRPAHHRWLCGRSRVVGVKPNSLAAGMRLPMLLEDAANQVLQFCEVRCAGQPDGPHCDFWESDSKEGTLSTAGWFKKQGLPLVFRGL